MNSNEKFDRMLRQALASSTEPEEDLNQSIINRYKERNQLKHSYRKKISSVMLVAVFAVAMSITAVAATQLFSPKQVAEHAGDRILSEAFESSDAIEINQTASSGNYTFTLHGIVSGAGLSELPGSAAERHPERTYAVISIARQDGTPMPHTSDPDFGEESFFISPLVKGLKPWQVNIASMGGSYSEFVMDGIMYRLIECDGVAMFADRGVYMAMSTGSPFYNTEAFDYNESTGEVSPRTDYDGASLLFDLPIDKEKADPDKAEAYLQELLTPSSDGATNSKQTSPLTSIDDLGTETLSTMDKWQAKVPELKVRIPAEGTVIPESIKEVAYDEQGRIIYEHDGLKTIYYTPEMLFEEGQTGFSDVVNVSASGDNDNNYTYNALQFFRDENGVITGRVITLKE